VEHLLRRTDYSEQPLTDAAWENGAEMRLEVREMSNLSAIPVEFPLRPDPNLMAGTVEFPSFEDQERFIGVPGCDGIFPCGFVRLDQDTNHFPFLRLHEDYLPVVKVPPVIPGIPEGNPAFSPGDILLGNPPVTAGSDISLVAGFFENP